MKAALLIVCGILVLAVAGLWLDRDRNTELLDDARRRVELYADSIRTSTFIAERDSTIAAYRQDIDSLARTVASRDPVYIRVREAEDHLLPVGADSLMRILDSDVPDPRQPR